MGIDSLRNDSNAGFSIGDVLVFTAIVSLTAVLHVNYDPLRYVAFLGAVYLAGWRLLNLNTSRINRIMMMFVSIAIVSPLLLWHSSPETRSFNIKIGYQWSGSYLYPFFSVLPVPFLSFILKCFRPKMTTVAYAVESFLEGMILIPFYTFFVLGI